MGIETEASWILHFPLSQFCSAFSFLLPCFTGCTEREAVSASFDSGTGDEAQQETDSVKQTQDAGTSPAADSTPPVIYGVKDKKIAIGDPVAYKAGVYAIDDRDGTVPVQVDSSKVDRNTAGTYPVIYTAEDSAGNIASVESRIIVEYISDAMMNRGAGQCTEGNSDRRYDFGRQNLSNMVLDFTQYTLYRLVYQAGPQAGGI